MKRTKKVITLPVDELNLVMCRHCGKQLLARNKNEMEERVSNHLFSSHAQIWRQIWVTNKRAMRKALKEA